MSCSNSLISTSRRAPTVALLSVMVALGGCATEEPTDQVGGVSTATTVESADVPASVAPDTPPAETVLVEWPNPGKYGCSESISRMVNGSFEFTPEGRGFITIDGRGGYVDPYGVQGSYRADGSQESLFSGGTLDDAVVTPLEGDGPRLWVVIPTESGERRWSCSLTDEEE